MGLEVEFRTKTQRRSARFTVLKPYRDQLGLRGDETVGMMIDSPTGHFEGVKELKSGSEVYGRDIREKGIREDQPIRVKVWRL